MIKKLPVLFFLVAFASNAFSQASERIQLTKEFIDELNSIASAPYNGNGDIYDLETPFNLNGKGYIEVKRKYYNNDSSYYLAGFHAHIKNITNIYYTGSVIGFKFKEDKVRYFISEPNTDKLQAANPYSFIPIGNISDEAKAAELKKALEEKLKRLQELYY